MEISASTLISAAEQYREDLLVFLQDLVRIRSVNGRDQELGVARRVLDEAIRLDLPARLVAVEQDRPNVLVELGGGAAGFGLIAHLDTVEEGDHTTWTYPPFGAQTHDGRLYGRGAADNKAGIACGLYALAVLRECEMVDPAASRVVFAGVVDEESGANSPLGVRYLLDKGTLDIAGAIYTYTSDKIRIGHRGVLRLRLLATGKAAHAGSRGWHQRRFGLSAGAAMTEIAGAVGSLEIPSPAHQAFEGLGCTVTVTSLHFGPENGMVSGVVPARAEAGVDVRLMPGQSSHEVLAMIGEVVKSNTPPGVEVVTDVVVDVPPAVIAADHPLVETAKRWTKAITGKEWPVAGAGPANEGWMLIQAGVPTLCGFGPQGGNAHAPDEYVEIESLSQAVALYAGMVADYVGSDSLA
jgi:succinyl-diaminopimelate desuccinylase